MEQKDAVKDAKTELLDRLLDYFNTGIARREFPAIVESIEALIDERIDARLAQRRTD